VDELGRLAQDALYFHEGPQSPAPQQLPRYAHQMSIPAGVRKAGTWQLAYSGIMNSQAINSQFYLDRQSHLSIFHQQLGLIITGANSKRQPELATFSEKLEGQIIHMPICMCRRRASAVCRCALSLQDAVVRQMIRH
jgi:hypothetical protein